MRLRSKAVLPLRCRPDGRQGDLRMMSHGLRRRRRSHLGIWGHHTQPSVPTRRDWVGMESCVLCPQISFRQRRRAVAPQLDFRRLRERCPCGPNARRLLPLRLTPRRPNAQSAWEKTMNRLGWLMGCTLALACAHESKDVVSQSDTKMQGSAAAETGKPQPASTADVSKNEAAAAPALTPVAAPPDGKIPLSTTPE